MVPKQVNDEACERVLAVEREFNVRRRPLYEKRAAITRQIPDFWMGCLLHHPLFRNNAFMSNIDVEALVFLQEAGALVLLLVFLPLMGVYTAHRPSLRRRGRHDDHVPDC